ncbi:sensor protein PfeS [mine drainage metagenome]|jgi:two-component system osmolarity sensor histidine kinase EnvZ|uniref:histidine kinase n=1 Tax=mine drainage metagenome TaxID=410659 RepID=A0A1J5QXE0_9ZZZZ
MPRFPLTKRAGVSEARPHSLRAFVFVRAVLAFCLILVTAGAAGYALITRPALERHARWIAADLFPRARTCDVDELRARLERLHGLHASSGIALSGDAAVPRPNLLGRLGPLPFDGLLARAVEQRIGVPVVATSSLEEVQLAFRCGGGRAELHIDRAQALGAVPLAALLSWIVVLLAGALALAAQLSRSLSAPLEKLVAHLRGTPLGAAPTGAPATGIAEFDDLAAEIDALRTRASGAVATRSALLMGLSHDLRAPLARLRLILDTVPAPTQADVADMREDTLELQGALDEFMRAANAMASPVTVDGANQGWQRLRKAYADPRLAFRGDPDPSCPPLNTAALVRVAANLIDNALRHTSGPVEVAWSSGVHWRLCVRDSGPGISVDRLSSLAGAFRSGAADGGMHAGLGLALATILCEHNGWRLSFAPPSMRSWAACIEGS